MILNGQKQFMAVSNMIYLKHKKHHCLVSRLMDCVNNISKIYEIDKDYYDAAVKRLENHKKQYRLF